MGRSRRNPDTGLTDKEERFCQVIAYEPEKNGSDAYRDAYNCGRMKPATISNNAYILLNKPEVAQRIVKLREERAQRTKVDADYVLKELHSINEMDVIDILNDDGSLKKVSEWPKTWRKYISGMDLSEMFSSGDGERDAVGFLKKVKWPDKVKNLELIGKHIDVQAFKERIESTSKNLIINATIDERTTPADAAAIYKDLIKG